MALASMFQELVVVDVGLFRPPLNHVQTEDVTCRRSREIIFVHADLIKISKFLRH